MASSRLAPRVVKSYYSLGGLDYSRGWAWQQLLLSRRLALRRATKNEGILELDTDVVMFFQHYPVYTLGRGADENYLAFLGDSNNHGMLRQRLSRKSRGPGSARLAADKSVDQRILEMTDDEAVTLLSTIATPVFAPNGAPIYRVERGGEVTFHGPGQLVVYPLFDLKHTPFQDDLHWFLRMVEEVIILTLKHYGIDGTRDDINTGVWVKEQKIAAVGVSASRWITTHGFALNIDPNLRYFDTDFIIPCGIEGRGVTSIANVLEERGGKTPSIENVASVVTLKLQEVFGIQIDRGAQVH